MILISMVYLATIYPNIVNHPFKFDADSNVEMHDPIT